MNSRKLKRPGGEKPQEQKQPKKFDFLKTPPLEIDRMTLEKEDLALTRGPDYQEHYNKYYRRSPVEVNPPPVSKEFMARTKRTIDNQPPARPDPWPWMKKRK